MNGRVMQSADCLSMLAKRTLTLKEPATVGAVFRSLSIAGVIEKTGKQTPCNRRVGHARDVSIWRVVNRELARKMLAEYQQVFARHKLAPLGVMPGPQVNDQAPRPSSETEGSSNA